MVKLLLTSAGIKNASIRDALAGLLGKPIAESGAVYAMPGGAGTVWGLGRASTPMCEVGWKSLGVLALTALPGMDEEQWVPMVQQADALLVGGGDPLYLCYWMRQSGLAALLPSLSGTVYVGVSAGSMVLTPSIGDDFVRWRPPDGGDRTLGLVEFSIFPHLDDPKFPENSMACAEQWAASMPQPGYLIDDQTAIKVTDGAVEVVTEGRWKLVTP